MHHLVSREIDITMTSPQRGALEACLFPSGGTEMVGIGGSRQGNKTHTGAFVSGLASVMHKNLRVLVVRQLLASAKLNIGDEIKYAVIQRLGFPMGTRASGGVSYLEKEGQFIWPNGSFIQIAYCRRMSDLDQYTGEQWDIIWIEQAEQFTWKIIEKLRGSNRRSTGNKTFRPVMLLTFNPGGIGAQSIKKHIVNPATRDRGVRYFHAPIQTNTVMLERNPEYPLHSLLSISDPVLRQQWWDGNYDVQGNLFFQMQEPTKDGSKQGTICEIPIRADATWWGGVDWGGSGPSSAPFAYLIVVDFVDEVGNRSIHVRGEVYQAGLHEDEQAQRSLERDLEMRREYPFRHDIEVRYACWSTGSALEGESTQQTKTVTDIWIKHGFMTFPSERKSRSSGFAIIKYLMRKRILTIHPDCVNLISEIQGAVKKDGVEDVDEDKCPDHALEALRNVLQNVYQMEYTDDVKDDYNLKFLGYMPNA